jgi:hypothetical protein
MDETKIVKFEEKANKEIIESLEWYLKEASEGKIVSLAVIAGMSEGSVSRDVIITRRGSILTLIGATQVAVHTMCDSCRED